MNESHAHEKNISKPTHGGDVAAVATEFGIPAEDLIDFSANINPLGPPAGVLSRLAKDAVNTELLMRYPEAESRFLRRALSVHVGVAENQIIVGNGAAALIEMIVRAAVRQERHPRCLIPIPAFSEYERALLASEFQMTPCLLSKERLFRIEHDKFIEILAKEKPDLCILNNPHNPTGALIKRDSLERIVRTAEKNGTIILLDEAFIDYAPEESLSAMTDQYQNLIVLRSLTKFYAIPALRVGYAIASKRMIEILARHISSWSVTTLAANAAEEAIKDTVFAEETLKSNRIEREFLSDALKLLGLRVYPSAANFLFLELPPQISICELRSSLVKNHHIIIRDCSTYKGLEPERFVRVAVRRRTDNQRLIKAMADILGQIFYMKN